MEKERSPEGREPPPAERDDVRVAANRCPFCHEDVARDAADVCRDCLARHHAECWVESQRCGACRSEHVLSVPIPPGEVCQARGCGARGLGSLYRLCTQHAGEAQREMRTLGRVCGAAGLLIVVFVVVQAVQGSDTELALPLVLASLLAFLGVATELAFRASPPIQR